MSPEMHGCARGIPAHVDMRLRWSDRGDSAKAGPSGSPFPFADEVS